MLPVIFQSFGGALYLCDGARIIPMNMQFDARSTAGTSQQGPHGPNSSDITWLPRFFGGVNSYYPTSYANHKPLAVHNGFVYQSLSRLASANAGKSYITRFDGSGLFINGGDPNYVNTVWQNGRGTELLSPSGTVHETNLSDMCHISHNDNLFIVGSAWDKQNSNPNQWTQNGWLYAPENFAGNRADRRYVGITITGKGEKIFNSVTEFTPDANNAEHVGMCDAIGYRSNVYGANWIDVFKVANGSGTVTLLDSDLKTPSPRCFATFPTSGYNSGVPVGSTQLMVLNGSGIVKQVNTTKVFPSGATSQVVDLSSLATSVRNGDNFLTRINSSTAEPGRSCFLQNFNNELHAFITTATSGYQHFTCGNSPSGIGNWTSRTSSLPANLSKYDSNIYGYRDDFRQKLYITQVTMGEVGVVGHAGIHQGAGGVFIYELSTNRNWREIYRGVPGITPRGMMPIQNLGPFTTIPSGSNPSVLKCNDYSIIEYKLHDLDKRLLDVDIEYSVNDGATWNTATRFKTYDTGQLLGSGVQNLPSNLDGIQYNFYWAYVTDVGFNTEDNALLRIRPRLSR